jgi:predicted nucleic acid-binding protein
MGADGGTTVASTSPRAARLWARGGLPAQAAEQVAALAASWPVLDVTPLVVIEATRGVEDHHLAYWDAQLWATARLNQVPVIFSEDFASDSVLNGVRFVNPFRSDFDLQAWI